MINKHQGWGGSDGFQGKKRRTDGANKTEKKGMSGSNQWGKENDD